MPFLTEVVSYANSANFTFNAGFVSFNGTNAQLKNIAPANSTFYAGYHVGYNGEYGNGSLTGTAFGSPPVAGNYLDLTGNANRYVTYSAVGNADSAQVGTIRFIVKPNYSGNPASLQLFFSVGKGSGLLPSLIEIYHRPDGILSADTFDHSGAQVMGANFGVFNPVSGTDYEIEFDYDFTAGAVRMFVNGIQGGSTQAVVATRSSADLLTMSVGSSVFNLATYTANFKITNLIIFNTVQHTANFPGEIPRAAETQFSTENQTVTQISNISTSGLVTFLESATVPANTAIQYILILNGVNTYWNGAAWVSSNGTFAQSNTAAVINTNAAALNMSSGDTLSVIAFLSSTLGNATPILTTNTINYIFFTPLPGVPPRCVLYAFLEDLTGLTNIPGATLVVSLLSSSYISGWIVGASEVTLPFDATGFAEGSFVITTTTGALYGFTVNYVDQDGIQRQIIFTNEVMPNQFSVALSALSPIVSG